MPSDNRCRHATWIRLGGHRKINNHTQHAHKYPALPQSMLSIRRITRTTSFIINIISGGVRLQHSDVIMLTLVIIIDVKNVGKIIKNVKKRKKRYKNKKNVKKR